MDIVERLRDITRPPPTREEAADEIERLREALKLVRDELDRRRKNAEESRKFQKALQKIADIEHEDLAAPKSPSEAVLWVCLDRCVTLAENALKEKE